MRSSLLPSALSTAILAVGCGPVPINPFELNLPPAANAGPDQQASSGQQVTLSGLASSDPDGDSLSYHWTQVSGPSARPSGSSGHSFEFLAGSADSVYEFSLTVTDDRGGEDRDSVFVYVVGSGAPSPERPNDGEAEPIDPNDAPAPLGPFELSVIRVDVFDERVSETLGLDDPVPPSAICEYHSDHKHCDWVETHVVYQAELTSSDELVDGAADFEFSLWDAAFDGGLVHTVSAAANVDAGHFLVELNFGAEAFADGDRWLEVAVRVPAGRGEFQMVGARWKVQ